MPSKLEMLLQLVNAKKGAYGARRVERAADEIKNLEKLYSQNALESAFLGDNAKALMTMPTKNFERYAVPLSPSSDLKLEFVEGMPEMTRDEYIKYLSKVKGLSEVPYFDLGQKKKTGRPSKYTPELAAEICERLSNGEPLRQICRDDHMPAWTAVYAWGAKDAELSERIARAREAGQDAIAEEIYALVEKEPERILSEGGGRVDSGYVQWVRTQADIKLKLLAKWNPKRYGDRVAHEGVENGAPIKVDHGIFDALIQNIELTRQSDE